MSEHRKPRPLQGQVTVARLLIVAEDPAIRALARAASRDLVDAIFEAPLSDLQNIIATTIHVDLVIVISPYSRKRHAEAISKHVSSDRCIVVETVGEARRELAARRRPPAPSTPCDGSSLQ